ncbi:MAG: deoxyguanosinetriphosphate triphosphohydrolase [Pyramidobacter sp.]|nr:deoxyguanosinetriphosphate triphosphohydrolase [Pyramidobacter sp.]
MKMVWNKLLLCQRYLSKDIKVPSVSKADASRSLLQQDYDRIIFSSSFRRLGRKTQVHPLSENDHIHTRLSHSLEVASIGRSLGIKTWIKLNNAGYFPEEINANNLGLIIQTACLAHDIGNPPFGHAGEDAIRAWFCEYNNNLQGLNKSEILDLQNWEGNAQSLRILTQIEHHLFDGGMRLTYPVLATLIKYPWTSESKTEKNKYGSFQSEKEILANICNHLGMKKIPGRNYYWCRHPLAYLSEAADDICYHILDVEDALEMKIFNYNYIINEIFHYKSFFEKYYKDEKTQLIGRMEDKSLSERRRMGVIRSCFLNQCVEALVNVFVNKLELILEGEICPSLIDDLPEDLKSTFNTIDNEYKNKIFKERRKIEIEIGSYAVMDTLLTNFCSAAEEITNGNSNLSYKTKRINELTGNIITPDMTRYNAYMRVLDYISGMTDNYATFLAKQLNGFGA